MRAEPRVSVIIPSYESARFLPDAIDSVLAQTFEDFEIIVVDDASTDATPEVLAGYGDKVRALRHDRNGGISVARNTAVAASRGDLLALLDADDAWLPEKLAQEVDFLDRHPETSIVMSRMQVVRTLADPTGMTYPHGHVASGRVDFEDIAAGRYGPPSAAVIRRAHFDDLDGFDPGLRICEDVDFWLRTTLSGRIDLRRDVVGQYRQHGDNISGYGRPMLAGGLQLWTKWLARDLSPARLRIVRRAHTLASYRLGVFELRSPETQRRGAARVLRAALRDPLVDSRVLGRRRNPLSLVTQLARPWLGAAAGACGLAALARERRAFCA